ncbi:TauD/TfdA family dioxygenase [Nonomuraea sp. 3N208]|uniref:TauD/TfdA family dioxygenase n=1 Tax=Nonomuraea sp. 3N208 TaxID=3457421 RepID=UPI003FD3E1A8
MTVAQALGPGEWLSAEIRDSDAWRIPLDEEHRQEVLAAVRAAQSAGEITQEGFPLPTLGPVLRRVREELVDGRGFVLVQGLPTGGMSERQCGIAALGLGCHVGGIVPQGPGKAPLMHVRDTGADPAQARTKSYEHSGRLGYHSDPTDIVALLCVRPAKSHGAGDRQDEDRRGQVVGQRQPAQRRDTPKARHSTAGPRTARSIRPMGQAVGEQYQEPAQQEQEQAGPGARCPAESSSRPARPPRRRPRRWRSGPRTG